MYVYIRTKKENTILTLFTYTNPFLTKNPERSNCLTMNKPRDLSPHTGDDNQTRGPKTRGGRESTSG